MSIIQIIDCEYLHIDEIVNKALLIRQLNEFNMYYYLYKCDNNNIGIIVY